MSEERKIIEALVRRLHHYGDPPDARLQSDVDGDVAEVLDYFDAALATAKASAAAVGAQVREEAVRIAREYAERNSSGQNSRSTYQYESGKRDGAHAIAASLRALPLPSGSEALAARLDEARREGYAAGSLGGLSPHEGDAREQLRATAERALREAIRSGLPWVEQDSLAGTLQRQAIWIQERLAALFPASVPASGRTTTEGG